MHLGLSTRALFTRLPTAQDQQVCRSGSEQVAEIRDPHYRRGLIRSCELWYSAHSRRRGVRERGLPTRAHSELIAIVGD
jgi:hypothetical protein